MTLPFVNITQIPITDPAADAEPSLWNTRYDEIDDNFAYVQGEITDIQSDIEDFNARIGVVEVEGPLAITKAVKSDWYYRINKTAMELWTPYWTLLSMQAMPVTAAIAGDDSVDVSDTTGLTVGGEYVIADSVNKDVVKVLQILTAQRFVAESVMPHSYSSGSTISKTSFTVNQALSKAVVHEGDVYLCGPIVLGDALAKSCVIHRNTHATMSFYFKDASHSDWTVVPVGWLRTLEDGTIESEYIFKADGGGINFKIVCDADGGTSAAEIYGVIFLSEYSDLGGTHTPPDNPVNSTPAVDATDIIECPQLEIQPYSSVVASPQVAVRFQVAPVVTPAEDIWVEGNIVWDSGPLVGALLSAAVPEGILLSGTISYQWRAAVCDFERTWSDWSEPTAFTTKASFVVATVTAPSLTSPIGGATASSLTPTLTTGAFAVTNGSDTHYSTQWQLRTAGGDWTNPLLDLESTSDKITHTLALGIITLGGGYYWRARHKGTTYGWSDWSSEAYFQAPAAALPPSYSFSAILSGYAPNISDMAYDDVNDVLYVKSKDGMSISTIVKKYASGAWTESALGVNGGGGQLLLTTNGIAVAENNYGVWYATKAGFSFTQRYPDPSPADDYNGINWYARQSSGQNAIFYAKARWPEYLSSNWNKMLKVSSNNDFASTSSDEFSYPDNTFLFNIYQRAAATTDSGREIVGCSSGYLADWGSKSLLGRVGTSIVINTVYNAGVLGLFVGTGGGGSSSGMIYRSLDGGASLSVVAEFLDGGISSIVKVCDDVLLAATFPNGRLYVSNNGGTTWTRLTGWVYGSIDILIRKSNTAAYALVPTLSNNSIYTINITR